MAITLETLQLEFNANFTDFDRSLNRASQRARMVGRDIERTPIRPRVELGGIHKMINLLTSSRRMLARQAAIKLGDMFGVDRQLTQVQKLQRSSQVAAGVTAVSLVAGVVAIGAMTRSLARFTSEMEIVEKKLSAVGESVPNSVFDSFGEAANRAGVKVQTFATQYAGMTASLKGKVNDPRELFDSLAIGLSDRGVVGQSQGRALTAIQQMAAKGVVSMEELRQQLGEALPGALTIAANSMGLSERQMIKMVSSGQLLASEFLPKFAKALQTAEGNTVSFTKELVKFQNSFGEIKAAAAGIIPFQLAMRALNAIMPAVTAVAKPLFVTLGVFGTAMLANLAYQALVAVKNITFLKTAFLAARAVFLKSILVVGALAAAMSTFDSVFIRAAEPVRKLNNELKNLARDGLKEAKDGLSGYKTDNFLAGLGEKLLAISPTQNYLKNKGSGKARLTASEREELDIRNTLYDSLNPILDLNLEFKANTTEANLQKVAEDFTKDIDRIKYLTETASNRENFGLTQDQALERTAEAEALQNKIDSRLKTEFDPAKMQRTLSLIQNVRKAAEEAIAKGADAGKYVTLFAELDVREESVQEAIRKVNAITLRNTPILQVQLEANAQSKSLKDTLADSNIAGEAALIDEMLAKQANAREVEARSRMLAVDARQKELQLLDRHNDKIKEGVNLLTQAQKERLTGLLGTGDFTGASAEQIAAAQATFKQESKGTQVDERLQTALNQLGEFNSNVRRSSQLKAEEARFTYETNQIIKNLGYELTNLRLERLQKILNAKKLTRDLTRMFSSDNQELFSGNQNLVAQRRNLENTLYNQSIAFEDAVYSVKSFTQQLQDAGIQLSLKLTSMGRAIYSAAVNGVNSYMSAAGIEDILGFGKFRDLIGEAVGIKGSDQRPQLQLEQQAAERSYNNQVRTQERQRDRLNRDLDNTLADLVAQRDSVRRDRRMGTEDDELTAERALLRLQQTQNDIAQENRRITGANAEADVYGVGGTVAPIEVNLPTLADFEIDPQAFVEQLDAIDRQREAALTETINQTTRIKVEGNREFNAELAAANEEFKANSQIRQNLIRSEGERIAQENENLAQKIAGTYIGIMDKLKATAPQLERQVIEANTAIQGLFAGAGIAQGQMDMREQVRDKVTNDIDTQLNNLEQTRTELQRLIKIYNAEGGADGLVNLLNREGALTSMDSGARQLIMDAVGKAKASGDYTQAIAVIQEVSARYNVLTSKIKNNREQIIDGTLTAFDRPSVRKINDARLDLRAEDVAGISKFRGNEKELAQINLDEFKAELSVNRQVEDLISAGQMPIEAIRELEASLKAVNNVKFDRLRKEASITFKAMQQIGDAMQNSLTGFFTGIGDALTQRGEKDNEILKQKAEYGEQLKQLQDKYKDQPDRMEEMNMQLDKFNKSRLDEIESEFSMFNQVIDLGKQALMEFTKALAQVAAQIAAQQIMKTAVGAIGGFANGGTVPNYSLGGSIGRAMTKEAAGSKTRLIVAQTGEQILSTRNQDAQFYRALKRSGQWDDLKAGNIGTYSNGGTIGNAMGISIDNTTNNSRPQPIVNNTVSYNITTPDANSFRKSKSQIMQDTESKLAKARERNS